MTNNLSIINTQQTITPNTYYVYGLVDPTNGEMFYIGKGTGNRARQHLTKSHNASVRNRVAAIKSTNKNVIIQILCDQLSFQNSIKIEAQMISIYKLKLAGGTLLNSVSPSGKTSISNKNFTTLLSTKAKAQAAVNILEEAIIEFLEANPGGARNCDIAQCLGLQTIYKNGAKDYLTWSVLGELINKSKIIRPSGTSRYKAA